ncbi:MAG: hypothetical protein ACE5HY_05235 [Candidatus Hydrothermarchaeales archaeon]
MSVHHVIVVWDPELGVADEVVEGKYYWFGYKNEEVEDLFLQASVKVTHEDRAPFYYQIQEIYAEDIPYYVLMNPPTSMLYKKGLQDILAGDANRFRKGHWEVETTPETTPAVSEPVITLYIGALVVIATTFALRKRKYA